ncbi:uncharacterized protein MCYG_08628 [Microsporum canis CBS 113480]|uniref:Uncharacterized protein n=1 Tax=Arthroderma otae (strain ATCC MYA-4605 / CBS 113480) TaxID=554155 RepID=C5G106_ARTOC|nr:uncharacterized protein MCYG_08628 [Microsporum canis CBS 113480]EEQ35809.1 predicted protein [Microsporum canis CBS 113480]
METAAAQKNWRSQAKSAATLKALPDGSANQSEKWHPTSSQDLLVGEEWYVPLSRLHRGFYATSLSTRRSALLVRKLLEFVFFQHWFFGIRGAHGILEEQPKPTLVTEVP